MPRIRQEDPLPGVEQRIPRPGGGAGGTVPPQGPGGIVQLPGLPQSGPGVPLNSPPPGGGGGTLPPEVGLDPGPEPVPSPFVGPPADTPIGVHGTLATPAIPKSLTPFRSPHFMEDRFVGGGAGGGMGTGIGLGLTSQSGGLDDEQFRRAILAALTGGPGR